MFLYSLACPEIPSLLQYLSTHTISVGTFVHIYLACWTPGFSSLTYGVYHRMDDKQTSDIFQGCRYNAIIKLVYLSKSVSHHLQPCPKDLGSSLTRLTSKDCGTRSSSWQVWPLTAQGTVWMRYRWSQWYRHFDCQATGYTWCICSLWWYRRRSWKIIGIDDLGSVDFCPHGCRHVWWQHQIVWHRLHKTWACRSCDCLCWDSGAGQMVWPWADDCNCKDSRKQSCHRCQSTRSIILCSHRSSLPEGGKE